MALHALLQGLPLALTLVHAVTATLTASPEEFIRNKFDFVVVGGGTAGIALAERLSESGRYTVGLLDSGVFAKDDPLIDVPEHFGQTLFNPKYDHAFPGVPQPGLNNRAPITNRGKVLGGSSAINFEVWTRASKEEYDQIAEFAQDPTWGWDAGFLPIFANLDTYTPPTADEVYPGIPHRLADANTHFHGGRGPIQATHNNPYCDLTFPFVNAVNTAGIATLSAPDSGEITGIWDAPSNVDRHRGIRHYSVPAFLEPNINRKNWIVLTSAQVTKVLLDSKKEPATATGVQFVSNSTGKTYTVSAKREVILSAGTIQTPQVLELSGVGNPEVLKAQDIQTVVNLPGVGENLQDHLFFAAVYALKPGHHTLDQIRIDPVFAAQQEALYNATRTGILTDVWSTLMFLPLQTIFDKPALASTLAALDADIKSRTLSKLAAEQYAIQRRWIDEGRITQWEALFGPIGGFTATPVQPNTSYVSILVPQLHPFSRGNIHIQNKDPLAVPRIDFKYLDFDFDTNVTLKANAFLRDIMSKPPMSNFVDTIVEPPQNTTSDEAVEEWFRNNAIAIQHPIGTAPLAARELGGVVDNQLRVYGLRNVRVADGSVIPMQLSTHPQATIYAIAVKAADMILESAALSDSGAHHGSL